MELENKSNSTNKDIKASTTTTTSVNTGNEKQDTEDEDQIEDHLVNNIERKESPDFANSVKTSDVKGSSNKRKCIFDAFEQNIKTSNVILLKALQILDNLSANIGPADVCDRFLSLNSIMSIDEL